MLLIVSEPEQTTSFEKSHLRAPSLPPKIPKASTFLKIPHKFCNNILIKLFSGLISLGLVSWQLFHLIITKLYTPTNESHRTTDTYLICTELWIPSAYL